MKISIKFDNSDAKKDNESCWFSAVEIEEDATSPEGVALAIEAILKASTFSAGGVAVKLIDTLHECDRLSVRNVENIREILK